MMYVQSISAQVSKFEVQFFIFVVVFNYFFNEKCALIDAYVPLPTYVEF